MKDLDLISILSSLIKHKLFIIIFVSIVSVSAVIYSLVTPEKWTSSAVIQVETSSVGGMASSFSGMLGSFASNISGLSSSEEIFQVVFLLSSREFSEKIITEFKLIDYFEIDDPNPLVEMDIALKSMKDIRSITLDNETNFYIISVKTKNKQMSVDIANRYVEMIEHYNSTERITKGKSLRMFLEKRVNQVNADINSLIAKIGTHQNDNNVILITEQASAIIENYSKLISQKDLLVVQKEFTKLNYGMDNPTYKDLATQVAILEDKIDKMENKKDDSFDKYLLSMSNLSDLAIQQAKFEMDLAIQQTVLETIYPQYELAILQEINDTPTITYIQNPREAGLRTEPRRAMICIISFFLAVILSSLLVIVYDLTINNNEFRNKIKKIQQ